MTAPPARPLPVPTAVSAPFWAATARGELRYARCAGCGSIAAPPQARCPHCRCAEFVWEQSGGHGTVYSFTVVRRQPGPGLDVPFVLALVTLDEGWHLLSHLVGIEADEVVTGLAVQVEFEQVESVSLPVFRPVGAVATGGQA